MKIKIRCAFVLITAILLLPAFSFCQQKGNRGSVDLDLGIYIVRVEHAPLDPPQVLFPANYFQTFGGGIGSIGIYKSVVHIDPQVSLGLYVKPGLSTNIHKHSFSSHEWVVLQLPVCAAVSIGKTDSISPGMMFGAGASWNYYDFTSSGIPAFHRWVPYFFMQVHRGYLGLRFSFWTPEKYLNKGATYTRTHPEFAISLLATLPY